MPCEPSVAKRTSTVLSVFSPRLLLFSFRLWWHLNGNHIMLSHPLTSSFGSRTNHSLTSAPLPLSIKLSPSPCLVLISLLPEFSCRHERLTWSHQLSWADCSLQIWTECGHGGWFTGRRRPQDTCVFSPRRFPQCFLLLFPVDLCSSVVMNVLILMSLDEQILTNKMTPGQKSCSFWQDTNKVLELFKKKTNPSTEKKLMITANRCLDLCSDAPQITPNQQLAVFVTSLFLVVNFLLKRSRISSGTLERERGETHSGLPGHCVSVNIWGWGEGRGRAYGGVELAVVKVRVQQTAAHITVYLCTSHIFC